MISPDRLGAIPLFSGVPAEVCRRLAEKFTESSFSAGQVIFPEGEEGDALYFIAEGRVAIQKVLDKNVGSFKTLSVLGPGDFFGEMALLEKAPRWASAVAQSAGALLSLPAGELRGWLEADAKIPLKLFLPFVQSLNARLRQSTREMILLFDVGSVLAQNLDATALATQLLAVLRRMFDDPVSGCFYLWNEFSGEYEYAAGAGAWPSTQRGSRSDTDNLFRWMAEKGECVLSPQWVSDDRFDDVTRTSWPQFKSVLAAPVMGGQRPVGHVVFGHGTEENFFTATQRRVLAGVVNLVAPAFENASMRLERTSQERLARARHSSIDY